MTYRARCTGRRTTRQGPRSGQALLALQLYEQAVHDLVMAEYHRTQRDMARRVAKAIGSVRPAVWLKP